MLPRMSPFDVLPALCAALDEITIPYCVVGGVALDLYGMDRGFSDFDFLVASPQNEQLADQLQRKLTTLDLSTMNFSPGISSLFGDSSVEYWGRQFAGFFAVKLSYMNEHLVDLIYSLRKPLSVAEIINRAVQMPLPGAAGRNIRAACLPDLVEMKKAAIEATDRPDEKRELDKHDLAALQALHLRDE